jgi:hypothetical protein
VCCAALRVVLLLAGDWDPALTATTVNPDGTFTVGLALAFRRKFTLRADLVRGHLAPERTEMAGDQWLVKAVLADQIDVLPV